MQQFALFLDLLGLLVRLSWLGRGRDVTWSPLLLSLGGRGVLAVLVPSELNIARRNKKRVKSGIRLLEATSLN
ncbi:hypothetical protein BGZ60DRAFT_398147 [Tricladium varicosporioides]|nr:hypothetical protein BGZ60DRAFT_398147 [Hymenoscyphus varicosporioides]